MKILLVDDDSSVLQSLMAVLRTLEGHEVRPSISPEKAIANAEALGGVDLLVTDVVMEGMNGFDLRAELASRYPGLRAIFISGYDLAEYGEQLAGATLLAKPFEPEALVEAIRRELAGPAPAEEAPAPSEPQAPEPEQPEPAVEANPEVPAAAAEPIAPEPVEVPVAEAPALEPAAAAEAVAEAAPEVPAPVPVAAPVAAPVAVPVRATPAAIPAVPAKPAMPKAVPAPVAVPKATPVAQPVAKPAAVPVAKAVPAAVPVAVPKATPASPAAPKAVPATPQAVAPKAVPSAPKVVATPAAVPSAPKAVPAGPTAVPSAPRVVSASPAAVPTAAAVPAAPKAVPAAPKAVPAAPKAVPATPTSVPVAKAVPASPSAPKAVPAAAPKAVAAPKATPAGPHLGSPSVPPSPAASPIAPSMPAPGQVESIPSPIPLTPPPASPVALSLLGQMIGGYQVLSQLGEGTWGPVFAAVQVAIQRPVSLKVLDPEKAADESLNMRFIADARAKANVQHQSILSVFEAGQADKWIFYTREFVDGQHLAEMAATGRKIDQPTALRILRVIAEGMLYFERNTVPHSILEASDIYLGVDGQPRLSNLATQLSDHQASTAQELETLGRSLLAVLPAGPAIAPPLRALMGRTQRTHNAPIPTWEALLTGIKALEPKVVPLEAAKISAQDRAAVHAVELARKQQKRAFMMNLAAMVSLIGLAAFAIWFVFVRSNERLLDAQVHIPAGDFIFGTGQPQKTDEFWIDKYEVSIGQYAKFVEWVEANPGQEHDYDHPKQPKHLSHITQFWAIYYGNAVAGKSVHSVPQSLNSPANMVTWWDAYAYAKWKGRELPTELEWERAARGKKGQAFTTGDEPDPKKANTNSDYIANDPKVKGKVDGFNYWGEVDRQKGDKSPDGVIGMQGNVSEWTATWTPDNRFPIIKGGNYSIGLVPLHEKIANHDPQPGEEFIGFRTISRTAPGKE